MTDLISIIVPVYKVEQYLPRCIVSLLGQTYKNIEIILVDDGSPDGSGAICEEYANKDERIKVIHKRNGGASSARNAGLDVARGKYVCFVDSDDYVSSRFIERLYTLLLENDADIAQCECIRTKEDLVEFDDLNAGADVLDIVQILKHLHAYDESRDPFVVVWSKIYKRDLFRNIKFTEGMICEDEVIAPKLFYESKKTVIFKEKLYAYFMSDDSVMRSGFSIKRVDILYALAERMEFYLDKQLIEFYKMDLLSYLSIAVSLLPKITDEKIKKEIKKNIRKYHYKMLKKDFSLKTKIRYTMYIIGIYGR